MKSVAWRAVGIDLADDGTPSREEYEWRHVRAEAIADAEKLGGTTVPYDEIQIERRVMEVEITARKFARNPNPEGKS